MSSTGRSDYGFAFSSKDRVEFSKRSLASLDVTGVDVIWVDGSQTEEGQALTRDFRFERARLVAVYRDVTGGPDGAIRFGLRRLLERGYPYCGLVENDIELLPGWLPAIDNAISEISKHFELGGITCRNLESRTICSYDDFTLNWNLGAAMSVFSQRGAKVALATYGNIASDRLARRLNRFGVNVNDVWELWRGHDFRLLGADWPFALRLMEQGMIAAGTIPAFGRDLDADPETDFRSRYVATPLERPCDREQLVFPARKRLRSRFRSILVSDRVPLGLFFAVTGFRDRFAPVRLIVFRLRRRLSSITTSRRNRFRS